MGTTKSCNLMHHLVPNVCFRQQVEYTEAKKTPNPSIQFLWLLFMSIRTKVAL